MEMNQNEDFSTQLEENTRNATYEFIGHLAICLFNRKVKITYSTLRKILVDNGYASYGNERAMARAISAAYHYWERIEQNKYVIPVTPGAIASTFVNKDGYPSWRKG